MEIEQFLISAQNFIWGPPLLTFILGTGIYLTFLLRGVQFRYLGYALKQAFKSQNGDSKGDINPFEALMTSLAGAIGTGNIVGVATAVVIGGMGSLFWMTVTAFLTMATKYAESLLAVRYRVQDKRGEMMGGPMQYMEHGLGWRKMAIIFAFLGSIAAIGTGNLVQVNAIAESTSLILPLDPLWVGIITAGLIALIIIGGVKTIGQTAGVLVPIMALFYLGGGLAVLAMNFEKIPEAFILIIQSAFTGQAAVGGFAGATVMMAVQMGVARSVFSNEASLGISSMAAGAAQTDAPARQALITMTGCVLSTGIVCTLTGLVLAVTSSQGLVDANGQQLTGAALALQAFGSSITGGSYIVTIGLLLFAFTTVIAWAYYGEKCFEYLLGRRAVLPYRIIYSLIAIPGAVLKIQTVWLIADIMNGLMVIPNLIAVIALSKVLTSETHSFLKIAQAEEKVLQTEPRVKA